MTAAALRRTMAAVNRAERARPRFDTRAWMQARRARTRHLIELGGLVHKAGFVELTGDDRAALLGALIESADKLRTAAGQNAQARTALLDHWRNRGRAAFETDEAGREKS